MSESFAQLFEESHIRKELRCGDILKGKIISIDHENVIVNAGLKSEGVIPLSQFKNDNGDITIQIGDLVDVALDAVEDGFGETRLSREKAKRFEAWIALREAFEGTHNITGTVNGK